MDKLLRISTNSKFKKDIQVLNYLQKYGPKSRVELSVKLNLTKAIVTEITNDMLVSGVLLEKGEQITPLQIHPRGRRKVLLDINHNYKLVFGVVVEKEDIIVGLTNLNGQVLDKRQKNYKDKNYRELLELIVSTITVIMKNNCITNDNLLAMGICLSRDAGEIIEGVKKADKISRLKKDLSYAVSIKIVTNSTIGGCLIAQKLFGGENSRSVMLIRCSDTIESGIMIDGRNYKGFTGNAGGFHTLYQSCSESNSELSVNEILASTIITCNDVLDTEKIYCCGKLFENEDDFQAVKEIISKKGHRRIQLLHPVVTENTIFLAACAEAINSYFYFNSND